MEQQANYRESSNVGWIVFGAVALAALAALVWMFGTDISQVIRS
jgi:hypothetical protein